MRRAVLIYDDVNAGLIKLGKYRQDKPVLVSLSQLMAEAYEKYYRRFPFDMVVPVPLSRKKRRERGFNQAEVLASSLSLEIDANLCVRAKDTPPQSSFEKDSQRWNNVTGVFVVKKKLNGKKILIVDDVVTSGATTGEMACVLKKAGAESVCVLSLAAARS